MTLASRVRVEILRAITRRLTSSSQSAYCPIYNIRPILHVGPLKDGKVERQETLTFVDSVLRFRHLLSINDLSFAYRRVGKGFHNSLRQIFIVLNEEDRLHSQNANADSQGTNQVVTRGTKRPNQSNQTSRGRGQQRGKRAK